MFVEMLIGLAKSDYLTVSLNHNKESARVYKT